MLNRRLSKPSAATVVAVAAVLAAAVAVTPSFAGVDRAVLHDDQKGRRISTSRNKKASTLFLKKKAAGQHLREESRRRRCTPVVGDRRGHGALRALGATTAGYIPTAFTSFATKGIAPGGDHVLGQRDLHRGETDGRLACPIEILVDGQKTGKVNFAPATAGTPKPAPMVQTVTQTTVLHKGGHTVAVQYAGAEKVTFTLKGWNLAVQAYPQRPEEVPTETTAPKPEIASPTIGSTRTRDRGAVGVVARASARGAGQRPGRGRGSPRIRRAR